MIESKTVSAERIEHTVNLIRTSTAASRQMDAEMGRSERKQTIGKLDVLRDLELIDEQLLKELFDNLLSAADEARKSPQS
jgi:hypothetical protein